MTTTIAHYAAIALFGLITGFFYAFSVTVMPGLDIVSPAAAIEAMQGINLAVRNPVFFITFFLTPVVALIAAACSWRMGSRRAAGVMTLAACLYVGLAMAPTTMINVPLNDALATLDAGGSEIWVDYSSPWTLSNHVRTAASLVSLLLAAWALRLMTTGR